ncbi:MAG: glycoside hydrolase family 130 protein, partial [bacterium]
MIRRYEHNPILTKADVPYPVATVHNPGAVKHEGRYLLLFRSHMLNGRSIIGLAESGDGFHFEVRPKPFLLPASEGVFAEYEEWGVEDMRVCPTGGEYLLTYSAYSRHGVRVALARTRDFEQVERIALITQADSRNVVLFPELFENRYVRLDRPHSVIDPWGIWISYSPDLLHWGDSRVVMKPERYHWDEMKIGPGATPIRTARGWLHIYHGAFPTMGGAVYRLGAALHDLKDPSRVLGVA